MRALLLDTDFHVVEDYPIPAFVEGEALVRVRMAGICNTDLELCKGYQQFQGVLGHEFVGEVEYVPDAPEWEGRRVVGDINVACGTCAMCRAGYPTHCAQRTTLGINGRDGAFAEYLTLPVRNLHAVPENVPDEVAVFTELVAAACEILQQVHIHPTDRVIVVGDGKLGLLCAQVVALTGCDLTVLGHHQDKLDIVARQSLAVALSEDGVVPGADVVIEATGNPSGYAAAQRLVRPRGTLVLKSTYHGMLEADLTMTVVNEVRIVGSRCGPFAPALRLLTQGRVQVRALIQARYSLAQAMDAFAHAAQPGTLKVLLDV